MENLPESLPSPIFSGLSRLINHPPFGRKRDLYQQYSVPAHLERSETPEYQGPAGGRLFIFLDDSHDTRTDRCNFAIITEWYGKLGHPGLIFLDVPLESF